MLNDARGEPCCPDYLPLLSVLALPLWSEGLSLELLSEALDLDLVDFFFFFLPVDALDLPEPVDLSLLSVVPLSADEEGLLMCEGWSGAMVSGGLAEGDVVGELGLGELGACA
jgi:hypothetical protein